MTQTVRSLRAIYIETRRELLRAVKTRGYLGIGTEAYATEARAAWRAACDTPIADLYRHRERCLEQTMVELCEEITTTLGFSEDEYEAQTAHLPLDHWPLTWAELGHYARRRGIVPVQWDATRRAGWGWQRVDDGRRLMVDELRPILGHGLALSHGAPRWAAESAPPVVLP